MKDVIKVPSRLDPDLYLEVTPGHFSSDRFHVNYYIDISSLKVHQPLAKKVAKAMVQSYVNRMDVRDASTSFFNQSEMKAISSLAGASQIDTIICLDGCEVIGAFFAEEMSEKGFESSTGMYIISPEFDSSGQMIVRENIKKLISNKHVLVVLATAMSGRTIQKSLRCIKDYGGIVHGVSVVFSNVDEINGYLVNSIFHSDDLDGFDIQEQDNCKQCGKNEPLDAIVNSYGYSKI